MLLGLTCGFFFGGLNSRRRKLLASILQICAVSIASFGSFSSAMVTPAGASEPAQDETLAYNVGVQTYIYGFPMMDLYRTLWETSFDPNRGHDRTVNEFFNFERLITSKDDWVVTPNEDTIYSRMFFDLNRPGFAGGSKS
jgi:hypothetical protein